MPRNKGIEGFICYIPYVGMLAGWLRKLKLKKGKLDSSDARDLVGSLYALGSQLGLSFLLLVCVTTLRRALHVLDSYLVISLPVAPRREPIIVPNVA